MRDFILDDYQLYQLTGKVQPAAQCAALRKLGIAFRERDDGHPVVWHSAARPANDEHGGEATVNLKSING